MTTTTTETDLDTVARLRAVIARLSRRLRPTQAATGLTPTQLSVLVTVVLRDSIRLADLAAHEGLNPTMLSRIVGQLVANELVRRVADPADGRAGFVEATAGGRRLHARIRQERNDALLTQLAGMNEEERRLVVAALPALEVLADRLREAR
jgi:DNA-binding MarR family transcriptional regulator